MTIIKTKTNKSCSLDNTKNKAVLCKGRVKPIYNGYIINKEQFLQILSGKEPILNDNI